MLNVAILVCKQSRIRLKHTKSYRAITEKEFLGFMEYDNNITLGIIEVGADASEDDLKNIIKIIEYCEANLNKKIILMSYKPDLNMDFVAYSNGELQDLVESETGYDVSTHIKESLFEDENVEVNIPQVDSNLASSADFEIADEQEEKEENIEVVKVIHREDESEIESAKIKELESTIDDLKEKLNKSVIVNNDLENLRDSLVKSKNEVDNEVIRLTSELAGTKNRIAELESNDYDGEIERLSKELDTYRIKAASLDKLEVKLKELTSLCDEKDNKIASLEDEIHNIEKNAMDNELLRDLSKKRADTTRFLNKVYVELNNTDSLLESSNKELEETKDELDELQISCSSLKESLKNSSNREKELEKKIDDLEDNHKREKSLSDKKIKQLGDDYSSANKQLEVYKSKIASADASLAQNNVLKTKLDATEKELSSRIAVIADKDLEIKRLKQSVGKKEVVTVGVDKVFSSFKYAGSAKIVAVFGGGSFGVTNTAYSIASRLKGKVLFIDLDISNPKSDRYTKKNPMVNVTGVPSNLYKTGIGVLYSCGIEKFIAEYEKLGIRIITTRNTELTWISGLYSSIKLENIDYTSDFLNYVGNMYDYIVIDSGKIGYSSLSDSLIKSLCDISHKSLVVSSNDSYTTRGISLALNRVKITNVGWVINLASTSIIGDKSKKNMGTNDYCILPFSNSIYGTDRPIVDDSNINGRLVTYLNKFNLEVNNGI
jgi:protein NUF1